PSNRTAAVYSLPVRCAVAGIALVAVAGAVIHTGRELRAYHAVVEGNAYRDCQMADQAIAAYTESIALLPQSAVAYAHRGAIYLSQGDYASAIQDYDQSIALRPVQPTFSDTDDFLRDPVQQINKLLLYGVWSATLRLDQPIFYANRGAAYQGQAHAVQPRWNPSDSRNPSLLITTEPALTPETVANLSRALADYGRAKALDPQNAIYRVQRGIVLHELRRYDQAIVEYAQALQLEPDYADAYAARGWAYFRRALRASQDNLPTQATSSYLQARDDFQTAAGLLEAESIRYGSGGDTTLAGGLCPSGMVQQGAGAEGQTRIEQRRANVVNGQAWVALKLEQYPLALALFGAASGLDPQNYEYYLSSGNVNWLMSGSEEVSPRYRKLIENSISGYERGLALYEQQKSSVAYDPGTAAFFHRTLGQFYYLLGRQRGPDQRAAFEQAIAQDTRAISLDSNNPEYFRLRGEIHLELADVLFTPDRQAALEHYQAGVQDLTHAQELKADYQEAGRVLNTLRSAFIQNYLQLAQTDRNKNDFAAAVVEHRSAVELDPDNPQYRHLLGWSYHLNGQDSEAISETLRAIQLHEGGGDEALARFKLAVLHLYAGEVNQARQDYRDALAFTGKLDSSIADRVHLNAIDDLIAFSRLRPGSAAVADEMLQLIYEAR
ncbi:MAG: tetratricopeptide repeat protein, partial [Chloroflexi bacterium]|nr:tetratricopeptide repeat protein [Chloroflexota bacterium]